MLRRQALPSRASSRPCQGCRNFSWIINICQILTYWLQPTSLSLRCLIDTFMCFVTPLECDCKTVQISSMLTPTRFHFAGRSYVFHAKVSSVFFSVFSNNITPYSFDFLSLTSAYMSTKVISSVEFVIRKIDIT